MAHIDKKRQELKKNGAPDWQQASKVFDERAPEYNKWFEGSLVYEIELAALRDLHTRTAGRQLEIGVGPGRFAEALGIPLGLDPAWSPLLLAAERGVKPCQAVGERLPVLDGCLGAIFLLFTLCFTSNPQQVLAECFRALSGEGKLVLGMVPLSGKWGQALNAKKNEGHDFYRYARFYTIETVRQWLDEVGFRVVEARSTLYQPPGLVKKYEQPRQALDEQAGFVVLVAVKKGNAATNLDAETGDKVVVTSGAGQGSL
ncbi:MAG: class I SAM-dependent methyltransferase [Proteobacteria bacterium]|nr:class I SAM-dependent methyltransferase [Pseudomonadota bacterium]